MFICHPQKALLSCHACGFEPLRCFDKTKIHTKKLVPRTIVDWNQLGDVIVSADSVDTFKSLLVGVGYKTHFFQTLLATISNHVEWCQGQGSKRIFEKF